MGITMVIREGVQAKRVSLFLQAYRHIAPLVVLRIAFGAILCFSTLRFIWKGWVTDFYVTPTYYFPFYGFEWVHPIGEMGMYSVFIGMVLASLGILLGLYYRVSVATFFLLFLYVELIDKTNYLNHYYFVSLFTFLLLLVPAHRYFSLDVWRKPSLKVTHVPSLVILIFQAQLCLVYFYAGIAKLNSDWIIQALPLKIWLPSFRHLPVIGHLLGQEWVAYAFSWFGAAYDLSIWYFLLNKKTRNAAYVAVIIFHVLTGWLFKIGMFPYIMILATLIFFSEQFHLKLLQSIQKFIPLFHSSTSREPALHLHLSPLKKRVVFWVLNLYFIWQVLLPFRFVLYPGNLFWTEEGFRFSWRVMLMEKGGTCFFYVEDPQTGRKSEVINSRYLTALQEKMMATQPDMILQFAHFLDKEYKKMGIEDPVVKVQSYVTLNGRRSQSFVDTSIDLSSEEESFFAKKWILPFNDN
jgi:hypothetical protein